MNRATSDPPTVAILGVPASGKSTLAAALAGPGGRVFRLREYAHRLAATDPAVAAAIHRPVDTLGWLPDKLAVTLAGHALGEQQPAGGVAVLEGYPGNAMQAAHLAGLARNLAVVELDLDEQTARHRALARRVCPACEPGPDPHRPASAGPGGGCARCAGPLRARTGDDAPLLAARTARYHHNRPSLHAVLREHGAAWHTLDARRPPRAVLVAAHAVLGLTPAPS